MSTKLGIIIADFTTTLATAIAVGGTTATLSSATDDDGVALPSGRYFFTLDASNSSKEHISCDLVGTSLTNIKSVSRQGAESTGVLRAHRIGCSVMITDFAHIKYINDLISGATTLNSSVPLGYDGTVTPTTANQLATKSYVDGVAISGAPDASTTVKGIGKASVAPSSPTSPIFVGDNDPRVPSQGENDALVGNNTDVAVGSGNKFVTQTGLQHNAETYAADAGSNDTYVITLSPVPTSYTTGMVVHFKANTINTGAATLNVNSLGAKTIVKGVNTTLADGDIAAGMFCTVIYDGTNFVLQNPVTTALTPTFSGLFKNGTTTYDVSTASGTQNIAHGLGIIPKKIRLTFDGHGSSTGTSHNIATISYNGTTCSIVGSGYANSAYWDMNSSGTLIAYGPTGGAQTEYASGVITFDATNIIITWTKVNSPTGTYQIMWEAQA